MTWGIAGYDIGARSWRDGSVAVVWGAVVTWVVRVEGNRGNRNRGIGMDGIGIEGIHTGSDCDTSCSCRVLAVLLPDAS